MSENKIDLCIYYAHDETGREIKKEAFLYEHSYKDESYGKWSISFGGWARYFFNSLLKSPYPIPEGGNFYIDIMGRNHYGSPVFIEGKKFNEIMEMAKRKVEELEDE